MLPKAGSGAESRGPISPMPSGLGQVISVILHNARRVTIFFLDLAIPVGLATTPVACKVPVAGKVDNAEKRGPRVVLN
jgi:hypothetical protein